MKLSKFVPSVLNEMGQGRHQENGHEKVLFCKIKIWGGRGGYKNVMIKLK